MGNAVARWPQRPTNSRARFLQECGAMWQRLRRIVLSCFSIEDMAEALMNWFDKRKARTASM